MKYEASVNRSLEEGNAITFDQLPSPITAHGAQRTSDYDEVECAYVGEKPVRRWLKEAHRQLFKSVRRPAHCDNTTRAARRVVIRPETVVNIPVSGPLDTPGDWVVERGLLTSGEQRPCAISNVFPSSSKPNNASDCQFVDNPWTARGEALALVERKQEFFDKPESEEDLRSHQAHAPLLSRLSRAAQGI